MVSGWLIFFHSMKKAGNSKVSSHLRHLSIFFLAWVGAMPALADDIGVCTRLDGVSVGPWTDQVDPACGSDCDTDDAPEPVFGCRTEIGTCIAAPNWPSDDLKAAAARDAHPLTGPMCFEDSPECEPPPSTGYVDWYWSSLVWGDPVWEIRPPERLLLPESTHGLPSRIDTLWYQHPTGPPPRDLDMRPMLSQPPDFRARLHRKIDSIKHNAVATVVVIASYEKN